MSVRKVKRPANEGGGAEPIEANKAAPRSADLSPIDTNKAEANEMVRTGNNAVGATVPEILRKAKSLVVTFPSSSFAPVKYGSFVLPAVSMVIEPASDDDPEELVRSATEYLQDLQHELFKEELKTYIARAKQAYREVQEALGEP